MLGLKIEGRKRKKKLVNFPFFPKILFWKIFLAHGRPTAYVTANYAGFANSPGSTTEYGNARVMFVYGHAHLVCSAVNQSYICKRWPEFSSRGFGSAGILNQLYHWVSYKWLICKKLLFFSVKRSSANSDVNIETDFFRMKKCQNFFSFAPLYLTPIECK